MSRRREGDYVELCRATTEFESALIVGRLSAAGLDVRSDSSVPLVDEWALSQPGLRQGLRRIFVRDWQFKEAQRILATPAPDPEAEPAE